MSHNHPHDHGHDHGGHSHAPPDSNAAFAIGVALNAGFVIAEASFGVMSGSLALLSDAGHNLSDVFGLILAWAAIRIGGTLPTKRRTYGLRRSTIFAALANAIVLLAVVAGIVWEALHRFFHPQPVAGMTVIYVAAAGVVINTATALLFMKGRKNDINIKGAFVHMAADAAVSLGVVAAGFGIRQTGWHWLDPATSLLVAAVIIWSTWGLLRESVNLAMDAVPAGIDPHAVEKFLTELPGVQSVHDLHIWAMSTTDVALTAHLVMPCPPADGKFLHEAGHELEEHFGIGHATLQIEHGDHECHQAPADVV